MNGFYQSYNSLDILHRIKVSGGFYGVWTICDWVEIVYFLTSLNLELIKKEIILFVYTRNISHPLFDYKIIFVNLKQQNTNSKQDLEDFWYTKKNQTQIWFDEFN